MNNLSTNILTNTGLNLPEHFTEDEFYDAGKMLSSIEHGLQWAIGDWYNAIPDGYGDKKAACERAGLVYKTALAYGKVALEFEMSTRIDNVSFTAHKALVHNELTQEQRTELLDKASLDNLSSKQLGVERDKVLGKETTIPETKSVIDISAPAISETNDNTDIAQASENTVHEEHNFFVNVIANQDRIKALETELTLLREQVLSNPPKLWIKNNFEGINDGSICSKIALSGKEALGFTTGDYSHNREINTWLSLRSPAEIAEIIKDAKESVSSKRKKAYRQAKHA